MLRAAKNKVNGYTQSQVLVRDCTRNNDTEDVPIMELRQLVEYSYNHYEIVPMFEMLDKRLNDKGKYWKHILKALIVLKFLVINGSEMCVTWCKENIYLIKTLREFMWRNPITDVDHGSQIRLKSKELTSLLLDDARLKRERDMAAGNNDRNKNKPNKRNNFDDDLQKALDESMRTAREEEERRRNMKQDQEDMDVALQLSKEEEELRRLQELQRLRQLQLQQQQMQQQNMMYDINGNPISPEEYQQFLQQQQQQQQLQYQQYLQQLQQQQQMLLQQQQYEMYQQQLKEQEEANKQNILQQYATSSNPFKKEPEVPKPEPVVVPQPEQPIKRTRTGDAAISAKYSDLNFRWDNK